MTDEKIQRINFLARKSKTEGLTPEELEEQKALRAEYIAGFRASLTAQLDNTVIVDSDGNRVKPTRKNKNS
ncbi:MAG: DUF896 domain-containing protein [Clostridia bacterium]|nr:DUF896 domain-containing protein [Clostridia bacterium]